MPSTPRSWWLPVAGLVLALDGLVAWVLSAVFLVLMNTLVAAIEGRTGNPNAHLIWWVWGFFGVGLAALLAAWLTARGVRRGRLLGALVAGGVGLVAAAVVVGTLTSTPPSAAVALVGSVVLIAQLAVVYALVAWRPAQP